MHRQDRTGDLARGVTAELIALTGGLPVETEVALERAREEWVELYEAGLVGDEGHLDRAKAANYFKPPKAAKRQAKGRTPSARTGTCPGCGQQATTATGGVVVSHAGQVSAVYHRGCDARRRTSGGRPLGGSRRTVHTTAQR
ncbi:MAG: hypothetical protein DLM54_10000 [Acidimicrobiales bacterium]|nr:MAG: hypothetical protein DLM54_10000 [Acidimicrobiales bacterium]